MPKYLAEMSPHERATHDNSHLRTVEDYLVILSERPGVSFGEYDNLQVIMGMVRDGLVTLDETKNNRIDSMFASLWPVLTDAGRQAVKDTQDE